MSRIERIAQDFSKRYQIHQRHSLTFRCGQRLVLLIQALLSREQKRSSFPILCGVDVSLSGIVFYPLTVISPTSASWCYPTTCVSDILSFSSTAPLSPTLSCPHILLLFSIHAHATSNYFHALFGYFCHLRYTSNSFIPYSVQLGNSTHPS